MKLFSNIVLCDIVTQQQLKVTVSLSVGSDSTMFTGYTTLYNCPHSVSLWVSVVTIVVRNTDSSVIEVCGCGLNGWGWIPVSSIKSPEYFVH
jgi:hypothetical protein